MNKNCIHKNKLNKNLALNLNDVQHDYSEKHTHMHKKIKLFK